MNYRVRSVLEHMLEDAQDAINFAIEIDNIDALASNKLVCKAVVMSILNIGELTEHLPSDYKIAHNKIPWKKISGMRDIAAHGYHTMRTKIIWNVLQNYLPDLVVFLQDQLNPAPPNSNISE